MPLMRHKLFAADLRGMRDARAHGLGDHAHRQPLQLRENVAPKIHTIERSITPPRRDGVALL
jgi:hypothetical protein